MSGWRGARAALSLVVALGACAPAPHTPPAAPGQCARTPGDAPVVAAKAPPAATPARAADAEAGPGAQRLARLGSCPLESGETLRDCVVGYRTFGALDAARSNVIVWPTWFTGRSAAVGAFARDKLIDTGKYHLIVVDALADGVSSSPSNSPSQARLAYPKISMRDMVESQRRLLVEHLGLRHVRAVAGISMGGMLAFQWAVSQPDFMDAIVPIVGSPRLTSHDLLLWSAELHALEADVAYAQGNYQGAPTLRAVLDIHQLALTTPGYRSRETSRERFPAWLAEAEADPGFDWNDWRRQLEAMLAHDVSAPFGGSMDAAAKRVRARALVVVAEHDHAVNPAPALELAAKLGASTFVLKSPCAHLAPGCEESAALRGAIDAFLSAR